MRIIEPYVELVQEDLDRLCRKIEWAGRKCYKSEDKTTEESSRDFISMIRGRGHTSVLEHSTVTVNFVVDRGVSHEIVRHRIAAYSQESTRYCNYSNDKFGNEITVIKPFFFGEPGSPKYGVWEYACLSAEAGYFDLLEDSSPQEARSVLPNSLKTEVVATYNLREWHHFFTLRAAKTAHPQMRQVAIPLLRRFAQAIPEIFADIPYDEDFPVANYAEVTEILL